MSETHAPADPRLPSIEDPHLTGASEVAAAMGVDPEQGLTGEEAQAASPSTAPTRSPPSRPRRCGRWRSASSRDPMNLMLLAVTVVSLLIGEMSTGV